MATFNNPLLFTQVSAVVYPLMGSGLVAASHAKRPKGSDTAPDGRLDVGSDTRAERTDVAWQA